MNSPVVEDRRVSPLESIVACVTAADPHATLGEVVAAVRSVATTHLLQRQMARALSARPQVLQDGLPPAPQAVGQLLFALRRTGAADVAVPSCGMCRRELPSVRGWTWRCERCRTPRRLCAGCGQLRKPTARDENGHWKCTRCRPVTEPDWDALLIAVHRVAPEASRDLVQRAARQAAPRLAQRRALATAVIDNPQLLSGRGAESLAKSVFRFIDLLSTRV